MYAKILLIALSVAAFSSCSTAYKSGQTPDDVYYSPVRVTEETRNNDRDEVKKENTEDKNIRMAILVLLFRASVVRGLSGTRLHTSVHPRSAGPRGAIPRRPR